jgi:hypothetical protein
MKEEKRMTDKEKRIQHLNYEIFMIEMKDHLDHADYSLIAEYKKEIEELQDDRD